MKAVVASAAVVGAAAAKMLGLELWLMRGSGGSGGAVGPAVVRGAAVTRAMEGAIMRVVEVRMVMMRLVRARPGVVRVGAVREIAAAAAAGESPEAAVHACGRLPPT